MAEPDSERRSPRRVLLVGPGRRAREAAAVLVALSGLDGEGLRRGEPLSEVGLVDLEELLAQRSLEGLLMLESGRVPVEDIGFVRRFLERHPGWRLLLVGEDGQDPRARALLSLKRAQWLSWPPDLDQLRAQLAPQPPAAPGTPARSSSPAEEQSGLRRPGRRPPAAGAGSVDLGELLEELLASAALQGEGAPRFQFRPSAGVWVERERAGLAEALGGLVELARVCAHADGLVNAALVPNGDSVVLRLDFPRAELPEGELAALLERPPPELEAPLAAGLAAARRGVELLRGSGARVEFAGGEPGRLRCEVRLSTPRAAPAGPPVQVPARAGRASKPEDPFA